MNKKTKKQKTKKQKSINFGKIALVFYIAMAIIFMFFTIPTNKINGEKVGFKSLSSLKSNMSTGDKVNLIGRNGDELSFLASDISYVSRFSNETPYKQNAFLWILDLVNPKDQNLNVEVSYDYEKLKEIILKSSLMDDGKDPVNAEVVFDEESDMYIIKKEEYGSKLDLNKSLDVITNHLDKGVFKNISIADAYEAPSILSDNEDLIKKRDNMNKIKDMKITYDFLSTKEELSGEALASLYVSDNGKLVVDKELARKYLVDLAIKYDTFNTSRKFKAKDIGEITVPPGIYGWEMNVNATLDVLLEKLNNFESADLTPVYRIEGVYRDEYNDIGPTYIEIDLGRQHLWYFKDGELKYDAPFVSGKDTDGRRTPLGVNQLWSKQTDRYLTGPTWRSHVDYWMPIDWSGVGLHDAKWRSSFGGDIYKSNGSHGCINMPLNQAKELYNMVELYTPVVVYDSSKL